jgi:hypothetical protein
VPADIVPVRINSLIRVHATERVCSSLIHEVLEATTDLGLQQSVAAPRVRVIDILVRRDDVVVAGEHNGVTAIHQILRVFDQPFEPRELIVELGTWLRNAVGQMKATYQDARDRSLIVTTLLVSAVPRQASATFDGI